MFYSWRIDNVASQFWKVLRKVKRLRYNEVKNENTTLAAARIKGKHVILNDWNGELRPISWMRSGQREPSITTRFNFVFVKYIQDIILFFFSFQKIPKLTQINEI